MPRCRTVDFTLQNSSTHALLALKTFLSVPRSGDKTPERVTKTFFRFPLARQKKIWYDSHRKGEIRMKKSLIFASIACAGAFALHAEYNAWFTAIGASASATNSMNESNGAWVFNVTNGTAEVNASHKLEFDLDDGETIVFNADQAAAIDTNTVTHVIVKGVFTPVSCSDLPTDAEMNGRGAQVGFVVGSSTVESTTTYNYYVWTGVPTGESAGTHWTSVGSPIAEANIANESTILIEFDYSRSAIGSAPYTNKVTFSSISGATTNQLGSTFTLTSDAGASAQAVAGMTCYGSGTLASADGAVQIGVAKVDGVKYGSLQAAANAAEAATDKTIEVVRVPHGADATVTLPNGVSIYDPEQKAKDATIAVDPGATVTVKPTAAEVASGASGSCEIPLNINPAGGNVEIDLSTAAPGKEIVANSMNIDTANHKITFTTQTAKSVLTAVTVGGKRLSLNVAADETALRDLLNTYAGTAYTRAYTDDSDANSAIQTALTTAPTGNVNSLALWQDYALGIQPTDPVKPVAAPVDSAPTAVTLSIPALVGKTQPADFTVTYRVDTGSSTGTPASLTGGAISVPLPSSPGGEQHTVKIVFE